MLRAIVVVVACGGVAAAAPARVVHGVVTVEGSSRPISGATVLAEHGELAVTDVDGYFTIETAEPALTVVAAGYATRAVMISGELVHVELVPASGGEVIEVTGQAPDQTRPITYELTPAEIQFLPGAGNDMLRAVQALPGVARIPYAFGGLVLRGTSPRDTAVYLDGIEIPLAFHFGGITSFYPSGMLADLSLTAGGFEAAYGRSQGGLVTLSTREPRTDAYRVGGTVGLLDSGVSAEGPFHGGGVLLGIRRSYFDTVAQPFVANDIPLPSYWDAQLKLSFGDPTKQGRISPMMFLSIDRVANSVAGNAGHESQVSITSLFLRAAAPYVRQWGPLTLHAVPWIGLNDVSFQSITNGQTQSFDRPVYPIGARVDLTRDTAWGHLRGGIDSQGGYLSHSQVGLGNSGDIVQQTNGTTTIAWSDLALWGESRVQIDGGRLSVKPGVRLDYYGLSQEWALDPRLNVQQRLTDTLTLRQSVGRYHQPPTPGDVDPNGGNPKLQSSYFDQASLGVDTELDRGTSASITGFFNYGHDLGVKAAQGPSGAQFSPDLGGLGPTFELLLEKQLGLAYFRQNQGRARSYGIELLVKRHVGRWFGMLAYTLSQAQRDDDPRSGWRPFELDQLHNLNASGSVMLTKWRFGARIQVVSGNPYSPTIGILSDGMPIQAPWAGTLPWFFQLDLRADRRWHRCWGDANLYIDIQNVTNRRNVEGRAFDLGVTGDKDIPGLPIVPFLGVEFIPK